MNSNRFKSIISIVVLIALLVFVMPLSAQEASPPALPELDGNEIAEAALVFALGVLGAWVASPATNAVVGILKRYVFTNPDGISGDTLALIVGAIFAVLTAVFASLGVEAQWRSVVEVGVVILTGLTGLGVNLIQAGKNYQAAKAASAPITGFSRTWHG